MTSVHDFLDEAPSGTARVLQGFAAAESLTDFVANRIYELDPIEGISAEQFLEVLHLANIVVPRNSEWHFVTKCRMDLQLVNAADAEYLSAVHQLLLDQGDEDKRALAGSQIPAYLFSKTGRAYHTAALGNIKLSLTLYSEIAKSAPFNEQWLAGVLAEEQQVARVLPESAIEPAFLRGMSLYNEKMFGASEPYLRRVTSSKSCRREVAIALHLVGVIEAHRKRLDEALVLFNRSVALYEELVMQHGLGMVLNSRGCVKRELFDLDGALADLNRAVPLCKRNSLAIALGSRSKVKRDQYDLDGALADINCATELGDNNILKYTLNIRSGIKRDLGNIDGALSDLDRAIKISSGRDYAFLLYIRSPARRDAGDIDGALSDLTELRKILSKQDFGIDKLTVKNQHKMLRHFRNMLEKVLSEEGRRKLWRDFLYKVAERYDKNRELFRAIVLFNKIMNIDIQHELRPKCMFGLGKCYLKLNKLDEAVQYLQKAIDAGCEGGAVRVTLAHALTRLGKTLEATREIYENAIAQDDKNPWAKSWFALALSAAGEHAEAEVYARAAVAIPPNEKNAVLLFNLVRVLDSTSDPAKQKEAIEIAKRSAKLALSGFKQPVLFLRERQVDGNF